MKVNNNIRKEPGYPLTIMISIWSIVIAIFSIQMIDFDHYYEKNFSPFDKYLGLKFDGVILIYYLYAIFDILGIYNFIVNFIAQYDPQNLKYEIKWEPFSAKVNKAESTQGIACA